MTWRFARRNSSTRKNRRIRLLGLAVTSSAALLAAGCYGFVAAATNSSQCAQYVPLVNLSGGQSESYTGVGGTFAMHIYTAADLDNRPTTTTPTTTNTGCVATTTTTGSSTTTTAPTTTTTVPADCQAPPPTTTTTGSSTTTSTTTSSTTTTIDPMRRPVLVYLHGGAWWTGGLGGFNAEGQTFPFFLSNGRIFREELAAGWAVVDVDYGLSVLPTDAGHVTLLDELQNVKTAIATLRALAGTGTGQLHIDPDKVVVGGESAGGTLAVLTGMTPGLREPAGVTATTVQGVVDLDGPTDLVAFQQCTHHNDFDLSQLIPPPSDPLHNATDTRFGAPTNHPEWRDSLPAAMNCPNGTFGAPAPPAGADPTTVDPIDPTCQLILDRDLPTVSPYQILGKASAAQIQQMAPMYLACSTPGTPNFPADLNCAAQEVPFMQLAHNLTGNYPVEVDETQGWHPDIGDHLNNQQLEAFVDQCVAGQP